MHGRNWDQLKLMHRLFASVRQCCYIWTEGIDTKAFWWPHAVFNFFRIILMRTLSLCFITRAEPVRWVLLIGQHQMDRFGCWLSATKFGADYQNSLVPKKVHQFEEVSISLVKYGIIWGEINSPFVSILSSLSFREWCVYFWRFNSGRHLKSDCHLEVHTVLGSVNGFYKKRKRASVW